MAAMNLQETRFGRQNMGGRTFWKCHNEKGNEVVVEVPGQDGKSTFKAQTGTHACSAAATFAPLLSTALLPRRLAVQAVRGAMAEGYQRGLHVRGQHETRSCRFRITTFAVCGSAEHVARRTSTLQVGTP
jgi:hypothetical protein